jgi:hypothetical protein
MNLGARFWVFGAGFFREPNTQHRVPHYAALEPAVFCFKVLFFDS